MTQALTTDSPQTIENELYLLEALAKTPETTQADLAARVGVAVGTVNWYLKRWSKKGYIKVQRIGRWNWRYLLTPEGVVRKRQLARDYVEASFTLYRRIRMEAKRLLAEIVARDLTQVILVGESEIIDICRLTCLELQLEVIDTPSMGQEIQAPTLHVDGIKLTLVWPQVSVTEE
ncbi:MAG: winged helix-turn-helix transcriptional regulator [Caldilineaceae bacterium]